MVDLPVSEEVLQATPSRVIRFQHAVRRSRPIRLALRKVGYTAQEHANGWSLLEAVVGEPGGDVQEVIVSEGLDAVAFLDQWDEPGFRLVSKPLQHRYPAQHAFVFSDLAPSKGAGAVMGVQTLLDRIDILESGDGRPAELREGDLAAIATLVKRGFGAPDRKRLRDLVEAAKQLPPDVFADAGTTDDEGEDDVSVLDLVPDPDAQDTLDPAISEAYVALWRWWDEWSSIARTVIKRRDQLIALGLANRKPKAKGQPDQEQPQA